MRKKNAGIARNFALKGLLLLAALTLSTGFFACKVAVGGGEEGKIESYPQGSTGEQIPFTTVKVEGGSCTLNGTEVTLSSFWISPYEVTQEEFESVMTGNKNGIEPNPSSFSGWRGAGKASCGTCELVRCNRIL